jgi:5-methylcytosine-specific restriction endonuclease McrA
MADACFMSVKDVRDLAESEPVVDFHCLDCGTHLEARNRQHLIRTHHSLTAIRRGEIDDKRLADLLCRTCSKQRADHAKVQRRMNDRRQQSILAEYRRKPYSERRQTQEWAVLKRQIHRRDGYRCRLCGRDDTPLHVHHCTYANYAEERLEDLITLCSTCHEHFHFLEAS